MLFLVVGVAVIILTAGLFGYINRLGMGFGKRALVLAAGYNVLIAAVKLGLAPAALHEANQEQTFDAFYGDPNSPVFYVGVAVLCLASFGAVSVGDVLLILTLADSLWLALLLQPYVAGAMVMLYRLYRVKSRRDEQLAIGVGAKVGNGLLVTLLGSLVLAGYGADRITQATFVLALTVIYAINFFGFLRNPDRAAIGYKG
jgi:hypothetical protein